MVKLLPLLLICISLTGFYRSDFDCKIPKGVKCKSLSEIKEMVAQGFFDSDKIAERVKKPKRHKKYLINLFKSKRIKSEHT